MNKLALLAVLGCFCFAGGCASVQANALPKFADGLTASKQLYASAEQLDKLVCSVQAEQFALALVSQGVEPATLQNACRDAAEGLAVGREALNTLIDAYDTLNESVGE